MEVAAIVILEQLEVMSQQSVKKRAGDSRAALQKRCCRRDGAHYRGGNLNAPGSGDGLVNMRSSSVAGG
jgi:hypothetical protein